MNDNVHPLIRRAMEGMYADPQKFDEWDNSLMHDIMGNENLAKPVQDLLILYGQLDATAKSFGVNPERFLELCQPLLKALREACVREFHNL